MTSSVLIDLALVDLLDARSLLAAFGVAGIFVVLFADPGLLVGSFLPGDSLLFTAGLLSSAAVAQPLPLPWVLVAAVAGALLGAQVGYLIGRRAGHALTDRARRPKIAAAMNRSRHLLDRYGHGRAIVLARFIPVIRTVLNPVAGALGLPARTFTVWQVIGGAAWTVGLVLGGFLLGRSIPGADQYLLPIIALIVVVSLVPLAVEAFRSRRNRGTSAPPPEHAPKSPAGDHQWKNRTDRPCPHAATAPSRLRSTTRNPARSTVDPGSGGGSGTVQRTVFPARHAGLRSGGMGTVSDEIGCCEST
jgi:membrane-associated protein